MHETFTHCHNSCGFIGVSISAFCHARKSIKCDLSRDAKDVRKYFSLSVVMRIAFGMTLATFSLPTFNQNPNSVYSVNK